MELYVYLCMWLSINWLNAVDSFYCNALTKYTKQHKITFMRNATEEISTSVRIIPLMFCFTNLFKLS